VRNAKHPAGSKIYWIPGKGKLSRNAAAREPDQHLDVGMHYVINGTREGQLSSMRDAVGRAASGRAYLSSAEDALPIAI
jgi:hypothetical protein